MSDLVLKFYNRWIRKPAPTAWQQVSIAGPGNGCTFAANDVITRNIKLTAGCQLTTTYDTEVGGCNLAITNTVSPDQKVT